MAVLVIWPSNGQASIYLHPGDHLLGTATSIPLIDDCLMFQLSALENRKAPPPPFQVLLIYRKHWERLSDPTLTLRPLV